MSIKSKVKADSPELPLEPEAQDILLLTLLLMLVMDFLVLDEDNLEFIVILLHKIQSSPLKRPSLVQALYEKSGKLSGKAV